MRKSIFILSVFTSVFTISCKKSYQCDCNIFDPQGNYVKTESNTYKERKRETAQTACMAKTDVTANYPKKCTLAN